MPYPHTYIYTCPLAYTLCVAGSASDDQFQVKMKEKRLYMQWSAVSANFKAVNIASAFSNDVPLMVISSILQVSQEMRSSVYA